MGLRTAAITRLARQDGRVTAGLSQLGVDVFARTTPESTCLTLVYPSDNPDERTIRITSSAGPFTVDEIENVQARAFVVGASVRGEVGPEILEALARKGAWIAADVQGFIRVARDSQLVDAAWPDKERVLARVNVLKTDAVEAEILTGEADPRTAARLLAEMGPQEIVLTHRDGVLVLCQDGFHEAAFHPQQLTGRSGRGDTCLAAYVASRLGSISGGLPPAAPDRATTWAAAVTSLKMEAEGPFRREISEVDALIQERYLPAH
jgi:sugar/nucleoside kinase (ribokinase family)